MIYKNSISIFLGIITVVLLGSKIISIRNKKITFDRLEKIYPNNNLIQQKLNLYQNSLPIYYTPVKKQRICLLISGFRDIPYMWNNFTKYLRQDNIDFIIPRINGFGRTYFQQNIEWKDWIISVMETMSILQDMYYEIDIIGFSTGCNIAVYISQFDWKCNIRNIILTSPNFSVHSKEQIYKTILNIPIISDLIIYLYPVTQKPIKRRRKYAGNLIDKSYRNNLYESSFPTYSVKELWKLQNVLPNKIKANNIILIKPNNDQVVGDYSKQQNIIETIYNKNINVINIPPNEDDDKIKIGHDIFNISEDVTFYTYNQLINYIK